MFLIVEDRSELQHLVYPVSISNIVILLNRDGKTFDVLKHRWAVNRRNNVPIEMLGAWITCRDSLDGPADIIPPPYQNLRASSK